jgi:hypothetical protein
MLWSWLHLVIQAAPEVDTLDDALGRIADYRHSAAKIAGVGCANAWIHRFANFRREATPTFGDYDYDY